MWKRELIKNKIYAVVIMILGMLSVPIEWDATFFFFAVLLGLSLFFSKMNCIY